MTISSKMVSETLSKCKYFRRKRTTMSRRVLEILLFQWYSCCVFITKFAPFLFCLLLVDVIMIMIMILLSSLSTTSTTEMFVELERIAEDCNWSKKSVKTYLLPVCPRFTIRLGYQNENWSNKRKKPTKSYYQRDEVLVIVSSNYSVSIGTKLQRCLTQTLGADGGAARLFGFYIAYLFSCVTFVLFHRNRKEKNCFSVWKIYSIFSPFPNTLLPCFNSILL